MDTIQHYKAKIKKYEELLERVQAVRGRSLPISSHAKITSFTYTDIAELRDILKDIIEGELQEAKKCLKIFE